MGNFELLLSVKKFKKVLGSNDVVDVADLEKSSPKVAVNSL